MAQVAPEKNTAHLLNKVRNTASSDIDEDLQYRIRSLLNSRNERNPARAPLPSPEMFKRTSSYSNNDGGLLDSNPEHISLSVRSHTAPRQYRSRQWQSEVGSSGLGGSNILSRADSNSLTRRTTPDTLRNISPPVTLIRGKARRASDLNRNDSTASKHHPSSQSARRSSQVVPPSRVTQDDLHIRPSMMHVPGSYKSDLISSEDTNAVRKSKVNSASSNGRRKENVEFNDLQSTVPDESPKKLEQVSVTSQNGESLPATKQRVELEAPSRRSSLRELQSHALDTVSPSTSIIQNHPRQSSLTSRPSEQTQVADTRLDRAKVLAPAATHDSGSDARNASIPSTEPEPQNSKVKGQAFTKAIDDLENLLTEALRIADESKGLEPQGIEEGWSAEHAIRKSRSTECSCTTSASSSVVTTDIERLQSRLPTSQDHKRAYKREIALEEQFDRLPEAKSQQYPPVDVDRVTGEVIWSKEQLAKSTHGPARKNTHQCSQTSEPSPFVSNDWAYNHKPARNVKSGIVEPSAVQKPLKEARQGIARRHIVEDQRQAPLVHARTSSFRLDHGGNNGKVVSAYDWSSSASDEEAYRAGTAGTGKQQDLTNRGQYDGDEEIPSSRQDRKLRRDNTLSSIRSKEILSYPSDRRARQTDLNEINLSNRHHFSIREPRGFSLSRSHRRKPIARDWSTPRKRFVATVTCITTSLLGLALGIYAGEVPAIQYTIGDEHHYTILGNVVFFLGLAASTILSWPLPVLHGRKPYTIVAVALLLPLQFPQALSVNDLRSPDDKSVRLGILLPRAVSGVVMGFANINFMTTLLDLFGASLQSRNPHQEVVNENDVRRHGGGMGAWIGIWTWCSTMSIGVGFLIGAGVISAGPNNISGSRSVSWGFWIVIIAAAFVLLLNVIVPETRRSAYRRSTAEVRTGTEVSRRVARGEIKMHLDQTGPKVWHEELVAGYRLTILMLKQPGFLVLALYQGWIYGQIVLVIALLGALLSKYYYFHPQNVGLGVSIIPFGALFGVPFQIAGIFSRSRKTKQRTDSMTFEKQVTWSSHLARRTVFTVLLPLAGLGYTLSSNGRVHYMAPIMFAGLIGFLSTLAIAECNGLIMETFYTSDLQPGMTGRPRKNLPDEVKRKRTNFSCFPRVTAGLAIAQTFAFLVAAGATGWGGVIERHLGAQVATAVVAGILFILTLLLFAILWRFKTVQIIPSQRYGTNVLSGPEDEWKPIIIGNPSGTTRRMSILELGNMSRWTEIRRRNRLGSVS